MMNFLRYTALLFGLVFIIYLLTPLLISLHPEPFVSRTQDNQSTIEWLQNQLKIRNYNLPNFETKILNTPGYLRHEFAFYRNKTLYISKEMNREEIILSVVRLLGHTDKFDSCSSRDARLKKILTEEQIRKIKKNGHNTYTYKLGSSIFETNKELPFIEADSVRHDSFDELNDNIFEYLVLKEVLYNIKLHPEIVLLNSYKDKKVCPLNDEIVLLNSL